METTNKTLPQPPNLRAKANILSALTFAWTFPLFRQGYKRDLTVSDLCVPLDAYDSKQLGDNLEDLWNEQQKKSHEGTKQKLPSVWAVLRSFCGWELFFLAFGLFLFDLTIKLGQPILLGKFLNYFTVNSTVTGEEATIYASGVAVSVFLHQFGMHPFLFGLMYLGMRVRVGLSSLLYRKLLRVSISSSAGVTGGYVINLLTNDASRFDFAPLFLPDAFGGIVCSIVVTYFLWQEVGISSLVGLSALVLFVPVQAMLARKSSSLREKTAKRTDKRIQLMNEIIQGIQAIKMYAWEKRFSRLVEVSRKKEITVIRSKLYYTGVAFALSLFLTKVSFFFCVLHFALSGNAIAPDRIFSAIMYFNILQESLTIYFPLSIQKLAECVVAAQRMQEFLLRPESTCMLVKPSVTGSAEVLLKNVNAKWTYDQQSNSLEDLNLSVSSGMLVGVIGQVGSGKSSLLHLILREMPHVTGCMNIQGSISYASQEPWLFVGTVLQNILFGLPMDKQRYKEVVRVCALEDDFKQFPRGDKTQVGEHGHSLSGGQRARINLARAVYRRADIYLLDDPLSAVDTHVGRHLFDDCISGFLAGKVVILCTHQLQYLSNVELILMMKNGSIYAQGTFSELQNCGTELSDLMKAESKSEENPAKDQLQRRLSVHSTNSEEDFDVPEEMKSKGSVTWHVYASYFKAACGVPTFLLLLILLVLSQGSISLADYWTAYWVDLEQYYFKYGNATYLPLLNEMNQEKCLYVLGFLIALTIFVNLSRIISFVYCCMEGSKTLHDVMFNTVSKATMYFFDNNPSGRILTRFSRDIGVVDEKLPGTLSDFLEVAMHLLGVLCIICVVNYWLVIPALVMGILFGLLRHLFMLTSRSLKRLEGVTSSPIYTHTNATLGGLVTIRSMHASDDLTREFDSKQNINSSAVFYSLGTNRAFAYWLDLVCCCYTMLVIFSFLFLDSEFKGGEVGLTITQALSLIFMCQWAMRQAAEVENFMTSVERVLEFHKVESEEGRLLTKVEHNLPKMWPTCGDITFQNVCLRYSSSDPPVLKRLNFSIKSGEKIGIVGRTGAGKSSLLSALFQLYPVEGTIIIDKVDTSKIGLQDLRSHLSVIPQEPVLFTGSLRHNIDPFEQFKDEELWRVLEDVKLKSYVEDMHGGLQFVVTEGGSNLSVGQRQLVCLARAILRQNKILILDEATANMDTYTDQLIQATLRHKFVDCTVLTVAHRLDTVMDCDRILVMDAGQVAEFGKPYELLENKNGLFSKLVNQTGLTNSYNLKAIAERAKYKESPHSTEAENK
ncbi:ABC-transporter, subfamily C member 03 [Frankliniella occidentalis]|nr:probable multidrug resistance-associated protein lethal(2)03659 isoform X2 [Frankliniella occidentalis]XP_026293374.1 probable multidrug resistance-associated protein lethal(2)03659 isoform X2 [Frankliniella occidentalis]KAE8751049.1 ABC-transporter, subfamily C member 03 [Frankliniella occidentalis]